MVRPVGAGRPLTVELMHTGLVDADVVVIGAGALGLSTALHCALLGRSVVVVERFTAGSQASGRAAGLFKSVQADELRTRFAQLDNSPGHQWANPQLRRYHSLDPAKPCDPFTWIGASR